MINLGFKDEFWEHRPFWAGGDFRIVPSSWKEASIDLYWHLAVGTLLHGAAYSLGAREMVGPLRASNVFVGEAFGLYRPGQVVQTARATHITGSAMSATEWAWFNRAKSMPLLRGFSTVLRYGNPIFTAGWITYELYDHRSPNRPGHEQRVAEVQAWQDSIMPPPE